MKRVIIVSAIIFALSVATGFSKGLTVEKENRNLEGFSKINFGVAGNLYVSVGPRFKIVLEGEKSLLDDIITEVTGDKLIIKKENWRLSMNDKVTIYITMPEITGLGVSGSGRAEIKDVVKADRISFNISGSGKILTTDITASEMNCSISGSGDIIIDGESDITMATLSVSGSGNYSGESARIETLKVGISGSGGCLCNVSGTLKATVSGSGNITYIGNPGVDARVSGSGRIRSR